MADKYFVDTNILIYAHDKSLAGNPAARKKHARAKELIESLWESGQGVLSTQVLQELCVNLRRKVARPLETSEIRKMIQDYMTWQIVVNTAESVIEALEIEAGYKISFWDALILEAAQRAGVGVVYSEDMSSRQGYGTLQIVNPFLN